MAVPSYRELEPCLWNGLFAGEAYDRRFYEVVEDSLAGQFRWRYLPRSGQPCLIAEQDLLEGLPPGLRNRLPFIGQNGNIGKMRLLMVGCAAGPGRIAPPPPGCDAPLARLDEELTALARREGAGMIVFKELDANFRRHEPQMRELGYHRIASMPGTVLPLAYRSFDDYLQTTLSRSWRKNLRRKFRAAEAAGGVTMEATSRIAPHLDRFYPLYLQTHERSAHRFERLTPETFALLGERLPDRARFFLWRHRGEPVAFAAGLVHNGTFHDLALGMAYPLGLELSLYHVTLRDLINWCLSTGLTRYQSGPLNYDPKLHLRMRLVPYDLYIRHLNPLLNTLLSPALRWLGPTRHEPLLTQFPNAREL